MVGFNVGPFQLSWEEIKKILKEPKARILKRLGFEPNLKIIKKVRKEDILKSVFHCLEFLNNDRLTCGLGKGGWGHSDRKYMEKIYNNQEYNPGSESIMTSVVNTLALKKGFDLHKKYPGYSWNHDPEDKIFREINDYFGKRWDKKYGYCGVLNKTRENEYCITPNLRHTAWVIYLGLSDSRFHKFVETTSYYIFKNFSYEEIINQKVATAVACFLAISKLEENKFLLNSESFSYSDRIKGMRQSLIKCIQNQFQKEFHGWKSGERWEVTRQIYSLFVCCEIGPFAWRSEKAGYLYGELKEVQKQINECLNYTICPEISPDGCLGIPLIKMGKADINATSLYICSLFGKPNRSPKENNKLFESLKWLVETINQEKNILDEEGFSWAIGYYIRCMAEFFLE